MLSKISEIDEISAIIPGRIKQVVGVVANPEIRYTTKTEKGIKCIAQSQCAVQEIFIVSSILEKILEIAIREKLIFLSSNR